MKVADIAAPESRFFLKSEYGPLSVDWPVVSVSTTGAERTVRRNYLSARDFILYLGTQGESTPVNDRGNLLSLVEIDTTRVYKTYEYISQKAASGQSENFLVNGLEDFEAIRGFDILTRPNAALILPNTDRQMWHVTMREIASEDRNLILDMEVEPIEGIDILNLPGRDIEPNDLLRPENRDLSIEALRLAQLVFNRVQISGQTMQHRAPHRSAPLDLHLQIFALLKRDPLRCALCGGLMQVVTPNQLLKISGDRKDSTLGDYGPNNYQLVHLACNLAKNNATEIEFGEWLKMVRASLEQEMELDDEQQ